MQDLSADASSTMKSAQRSVAAVLTCETYGVAFGDKLVLAEVDLEVRAPGVTTLMGPGGVGKSTLLNSLAGVVKSALHRSWGTVTYQGAPLGTGNRPSLVKQRIELVQRSTFDNLTARLDEEQIFPRAQRRARIIDWLEQLRLPGIVHHLDSPFTDLESGSQRIVAILREAFANPALLMLDEPTSGLSDSDADCVLDLIETLGKRIPLLVVLHNQKQARRISKSIILLAGGRVQAQNDATAFFEAEQHPVVRQFVTTGSCAVPSPDAQLEMLAAHIEPPPPLPESALKAMRVASSERRPPQLLANRSTQSPATSTGPQGFVWVIEGRLAGAPYPGIIHGADYDLQLLALAGVTTLVTLTERRLPQILLERYGFDNLHCAIEDRKAPTIAQTESLLGRMAKLLDEGKVLAVHCWAGAGRTGVVLAAFLIRERALTAGEALAQLRTLNPEFVQTAEQEAFLSSYEHHLRNTKMSD